jgi:alanine racemase
MPNTQAQIDLDALTVNLGLIRAHAGSRTVMAVVKANGYGHGAVPVAKRLHAQGVRDFAVATVAEGVALRKAGIPGSILVFGAVWPTDFGVLSEHALDLSVTSTDTVRDLKMTDTALGVHLNVDTGMTRLGLSPEQTIAALRTIQSRPNLRLLGIYTHLSAADRPSHPVSRAQLTCWERFLGVLGEPPCPTHVVSSGGILANPDALAHTQVVRAGIALYGLYQGQEGSEAARRFQPVMRLVSRVARVAEVPEGTPVSYGGSWTAPSRTRVITVAAGYADGYPRRLSNLGSVGIHGHRLPIVGTVCMDMLMVHAADPDMEIRVGDEVVLFGPGGPSCAQVAQWAGTITYEIACGVSDRVERVYQG